MKNVIITGATGNLGQAVTAKFIKEGYIVIGTTTSKDRSTNNFPAEFFEKFVVDLLVEEDAEKFVADAIDKYKNIDVAVLTVGGFAMGNVADTKSSDILKQYKVNFETAYNVARPVFEQMMKQQKGRIFLIGSKPGLSSKNGKGMIGYGLAKSLIFRLAELMNEEAKGKNVVVSVVVPGTIDTPPNRKDMPDSDFNKWVKAEDIADVIAWHCKNEANALRETVLKVYNFS